MTPTDRTGLYDAAGYLALFSLAVAAIAFFAVKQNDGLRATLDCETRLAGEIHDTRDVSISDLDAIEDACARSGTSR